MVDATGKRWEPKAGGRSYRTLHEERAHADFHV